MDTPNLDYFLRLNQYQEAQDYFRLHLRRLADLGERLDHAIVGSPEFLLLSQMAYMEATQRDFWLARVQALGKFSESATAESTTSQLEGHPEVLDPLLEGARSLVEAITAAYPRLPREVASLVNLYQETLAKARAEHPGLE
jgi:hypothetical protein